MQQHCAQDTRLYRIHSAIPTQPNWRLSSAKISRSNRCGVQQQATSVSQMLYSSREAAAQLLSVIQLLQIQAATLCSGYRLVRDTFSNNNPSRWGVQQCQWDQQHAEDNSRCLFPNSCIQAGRLLQVAQHNPASAKTDSNTVLGTHAYTQHIQQLHLNPFGD